MDYSKLSDEDLQAIYRGDFKALSTEGLYLLQNKPVEYSPEATLRNLGPSAKKFGQNTFNAIVHPFDTIGGVNDLIMGGMGKAAQALGAEVPPDMTAAADAFINGLNKQYGSLDRLKITAMEDPVQMASDAAALLSGAGAATRSSTLSKLGHAVDPTNIMYGAGKTALKGIVHLLPKDFSIRTLAGATGITEQAILKELLDRGINPGKVKDLEKLAAERTARGEDLRALVEANNVPVKASGLFEGMLDVQQDLDKTNVGAGSPRSSFDSYVHKLGKHAGYRPAMSDPDFDLLRGNTPVPPQYINTGSYMHPVKTLNPDWVALQTANDADIPLTDVWELKKGGWDSILDRQGHLKSPAPGPSQGILAGKKQATFNAHKILSDALQGTDYAEQNQKLSALIDTADAAQKAHPSMYKKDNFFSQVGSVPVSAAGAAGYAIGGPVWGGTAALGALGASILSTPTKLATLGLNVHKNRTKSLMDILRDPNSSGWNLGLNIGDRLREEEEEKIRKAIRGY